MSLDQIQKKWPDITEASYESLPIEVALKDVQSSAPGHAWALLEVAFLLPSEGFSYYYSLSVETILSVSYLQSLISTSLKFIP